MLLVVLLEEVVLVLVEVLLAVGLVEKERVQVVRVLVHVLLEADLVEEERVQVVRVQLL